MSTRACWLSAVLLVICLHLVSSSSFWNKQQLNLRSLENDEHESLSPRRSRRASPDQSILDGSDIMLTKEQYARLHSGVKGRSSGGLASTPWKDGIIPYKIRDNQFLEEERIPWIERAMRNWEAVSCVKFRPKEDSDTDWIEIKEGQGCWAHLGMLGGHQYVNLDKGCFWIGMIEHELGHTLGLIHEHQREQRDAYIRISYYEVLNGLIDAVTKYAKGADDKMGLPYDYHSVMHYGKEAFAKNGYTQTVFTRDPTKEDVIGLTLLPSFLDAKFVNLMYKCADQCENKPSCPDDCFVNKDCKCVCENDIPKETCQDHDEKCPEWASAAECHGDPFYMHTFCRKSCGICKTDGSTPQLPCVNSKDLCYEWKDWGHCESNAGHLHVFCRLACGLCKEGEDYSPKGPCEDKNATCREMAEKGECTRNTARMLKDCTKSCEFCPEDVGKELSQAGCVDYDSICYYWADSNLCHKHYGWMAKNCRKGCGTCDNVTSIVPENCVDHDPECQERAFNDDCYNNEEMGEKCPLSCNTCEGLVKPPEECLDYRFSCKWWADVRFECWGNPDWMARNCKQSCGLCPGDPPTSPAPCMDYRGECPQWQREGECEGNPGWMNDYCKVSCGVCQPDGSGDCIDYDERCADDAEHGDCEARPDYMGDFCKGSCREECKNRARLLP